MNQYEEDIVYDYIINGVSQRRLANREDCAEEEIRYLINDLGFNKTNDGKWAGDDFDKWSRLKRAGFNEDEIRGFISDYSDRYANSRKDFKEYLEKELQVSDAYNLPSDCAERWRSFYDTKPQNVIDYSPQSKNDFKKVHKSGKNVSLATVLIYIVCLAIMIALIIKFGKYILIGFGVLLLLGLICGFLVWMEERR